MRVAVLGAGYAGLTVARRLEWTLPDDVELVVVDDTGEHLLKHELHRIVRRPGLADDLRIPLADVLDRASVRRARVEAVDPDAGVATLDDGELPYDYAAVCLGATTAYHDLPGVDEHSAPLERVEDALAIRQRFLEVLGDGGRVVVGGAGLSGVQIAGELAEIAGERDARERVQVVLLEQFPTVAPGFASSFQRAIREELGARDVEVRTGTAVSGADPDRVETEDGDVEYDQFVWTGGIRGPDALSGERPRVRPTFAVDGSTLVLGDAARVVDRNGEPVPASAQAAVREARVATRNLRQLVEGERAGAGAFDPRLEQFSFRPLGWTVSVGDATVAQVGPTVLRGRAAKAAKATSGLAHLLGIGRLREGTDVVRAELD